MSLTRTEYLVQRLRQGEVYGGTHGPYDSLDWANKQKATAERLREANGPGVAWWSDSYRVVERDVTEWRPVPSAPPEWPEDD